MEERSIRELFASDIDRNIEEVIKVDQDDDQIVRDELAEYVATDSIRKHFLDILEKYKETPNKPHEGVGIWISGFFGSGKSSFAKYLGFALENREFAGERAGPLLANRLQDHKAEVLLTTINEQIPTHAVIFDVAADRGVRNANQTITEILYRVFLRSLGYARDLDLAELEVALEEEGRLDEFKAKYAEMFEKDWDAEKGKLAFAVSEASGVMHELEPSVFTTPDSWWGSVGGRADITPKDLAKRCELLMSRRRPGQTLVFVVDEVGQFVARDVQKMLDLSAVVEHLGLTGRGKMWLAVTSQEKLSEVVSGLDSKKVELQRLLDRFPLRPDLEPSDISEVTSKRVLSKNADGEEVLRGLFEKHRGRLSDHTKLSAAIKLPELTAESFIDLYPLLPYQIDLIISVVSGLRTAGGASPHVGGANRTIIKLAQELLIRKDVNLGDSHLGQLARIDQIYDLVSGNIASEIRGKIDAIRQQVEHPFAQPAAKAICLLQYSQSVHRSPENIAATLHATVDGDSKLPDVKAALEALEAARLVLRGEDGAYRIPTPAEDDWEKQRAAALPKPADVNRLHIETLKALWKPQPSYSLLGIRTFKAGLTVNGQSVEEGDIDMVVELTEPAEAQAATDAARTRSQSERSTVFWTASLTEAIDRATVELFRSRDVLSRKERGAQTKDETALVADEKRRLKRHEDELRRLIRQALLGGSVYFRGNDRSPNASATEVGKATADVLSVALPEVFDRFSEAAGNVKKSDLDALLTSENLSGLPSVFTDLGLIRDESGKPVFNVDSGPLGDVMATIQNRAQYGETPSGRHLADEFGKEPFGWDFDVVRILVVSLLRAGQIRATSGNQTIDLATSIEARNTFPKNNLFRAASFLPKVIIDFKHVVEAGEAFKTTFGRDVSELEQSVVAREIREAIEGTESAVRDAHTRLVQNSLPGDEVLATALGQMAAIRREPDDQAILTFVASHHEQKEAIKRAAELTAALTEEGLAVVKKGRRALAELWPVLKAEADLSDEESVAAEALEDLLARETFFRELASISTHAGVLEDGYKARLTAAGAARAAAYEAAVEQLRATPGWDRLEAEQQEDVAQVLVRRAEVPQDSEQSIPLLREQTSSCSRALSVAMTQMLEMLDGNRLAQVSIAPYFAGGVESEDEASAAIEGLREEILELIAVGKKVIVE